MDDADRLSIREMDVVRGIAKGTSVKNLAKRLNISGWTVRIYIKTAAAKIGDRRGPPMSQLIRWYWKDFYPKLGNRDLEG